MTDRPAVDNMLAALNVRANAVRGFTVGVVLAAAVFVFFVAIPGSRRPASLYVLLGFVFAVTTGLLATVVLVAVTAYRLSRTVE